MRDTSLSGAKPGTSGRWLLRAATDEAPARPSQGRPAEKVSVCQTLSRSALGHAWKGKGWGTGECGAALDMPSRHT